MNCKSRHNDCQCQRQAGHTDAHVSFGGTECFSWKNDTFNRDLVFAIAELMDFDPDFQDAADPEDDKPHYIDAECNKIPDYVRILGRSRAEQLLEMLLVVKGVA